MKREAICSVVLLAVLISALMPSTFANAETLFSPSEDPKTPVIIFKSQEALEEGTKFLASGGSIFNYKIFGQYVRAIAESGTKCLVLKSKLGKKQIRVLEGVHAGKVGWVHSEMVR